jgi:hypothetical protein
MLDGLAIAMQDRIDIVRFVLGTISATVVWRRVARGHARFGCDVHSGGYL